MSKTRIYDASDRPELTSVEVVPQAVDDDMLVIEVRDGTNFKVFRIKKAGKTALRVLRGGKKTRTARSGFARPDPADVVRQEYERHGVLMDLLAK